MERYLDNDTKRTAKAGQMPAKPTALELLAMLGGPVAIGPGDWLVQYEDDGSLFVTSAAAFSTRFAPIISQPLPLE